MRPGHSTLIIILLASILAVMLFGRDTVLNDLALVLNDLALVAILVVALVIILVVLWAVYAFGGALRRFWNDLRWRRRRP